LEPVQAVLVTFLIYNILPFLSSYNIWLISLFLALSHPPNHPPISITLLSLPVLGAFWAFNDRDGLE
jgi:hypothetical protein